MRIIFRLADKSVAEELSDYDMKLFENGMGPSQLRAEIDAGSCLIARMGSELVGYALVRRQGALADLTRVAVVPSFQGQGFGRQLLQEALLLHRSPRYMLNVRKDNDAAIELYRSEGFKIRGTVGASWLMLKSTES